MRNETQGENGIVLKEIISAVFLSIKRASDISPFHLVPRGPLGRGRDISSPAIWATKIFAHFGDAGSNRSKNLAGTEIAKQS